MMKKKKQKEIINITGLQQWQIKSKIEQKKKPKQSKRKFHTEKEMNLNLL